jgi:hypothetical protein
MSITFGYNCWNITNKVPNDAMRRLPIPVAVWASLVIAAQITVKIQLKSTSMTPMANNTFVFKDSIIKIPYPVTTELDLEGWQSGWMLVFSFFGKRLSQKGLLWGSFEENKWKNVSFGIGGGSSRSQRRGQGQYSHERFMRSCLEGRATG